MRPRLYVAAVLGGLAVMAALAVVVLQFGRHDPSPPSLRDNPNPAIPGELLYLNRDGCIMRVAASGASQEEIYCIAGQNTGPGVVTWVDEGTAGYFEFGRAGPELITIDLATRTETRTGRIIDPFVYKPGVPGATVNAQGESVTVDDDGTVVIVHEGRREEIADFDVARYNQPRPITWSPDAEWIVLHYYPRHAEGWELWLISRDGQTRGTLATDLQANTVSWWIDGHGFTPQIEGIPE